MTDKGDTQQAPFDMASCAAMMEKMMAQMGAACDCAGMTSRKTDQAERGCCDCSGMMARMRAMWEETQDKAD